MKVYSSSLIKNRAFTLIELLVVIVIIAILAAILFPVFTQAKESAKRTACISNIKQITLATLMYVDDYNEKVPSSNPISPPAGSGWYSGVQYWYGAMYQTTPSYFGPKIYEAKDGMLVPYMKNVEIADCPKASDLPLYPWLDPGDVNKLRVAYAGGSAMFGHGSLETVEIPAETILLADTATLSNGVAVRAIYGFTLTYPYNFTLTLIHGRHNKRATIGWCDGHVKVHLVEPLPLNGTTIFDSSSSYAKNNLGIVYKWPRISQSFDDSNVKLNGFSKHVYDFYYYYETKPPSL